jgi:hypothetical protein
MSYTTRNIFKVAQDFWKATSNLSTIFPKEIIKKWGRGIPICITMFIVTRKKLKNNVSSQYRGWINDGITTRQPVL